MECHIARVGESEISINISCANPSHLFRGRTGVDFSGSSSRQIIAKSPFAVPTLSDYISTIDDPQYYLMKVVLALHVADEAGRAETKMDIIESLARPPTGVREKVVISFHP